MAEESKEKWLNYLALTTVILAVCATLSTFKGAGFSTRSVLSQTQAANQWAYYQAKSIKGYLYEIQKETLELEFKKNKVSSAKSLNSEYEKKIALYSQKIKKYDKEKAEISKEAKNMETIRDDAQTRAGIFGLAVIFLTDCDPAFLDRRFNEEKICLDNRTGDWCRRIGLLCERFLHVFLTRLYC